MKLMSFNTQHCLNYVTRAIDFEVMAEAVKACDADIVGLNEMRDGDTHPEFLRQTEILSGLTGLSHHVFARAIDLPEGLYGNGLISRYPIERAKVISVPDPATRVAGKHYETRCLLKVKLANGLTVMVIHMGLNPDEQENAVATVAKHLEAEKCVLMGDFNVNPDDPVLAPIRERMKDTAEVFAEPLLSFPSDRPKRKIDYIFVTPDVEVVAADIPSIVASDHRPHTAEIRL